MSDLFYSHSQDASNIYYIMTKKFGQVLDVWVKAGIFFFRNKKFDEARKYMDRALIALDKKHRKSDCCFISSLCVGEGNELVLVRKEKKKKGIQYERSNYASKVCLRILYLAISNVLMTKFFFFF